MSALAAITEQYGGVALTAAVSAVALVASLILLVVTVAVIPHDYFARHESAPSRFAGHGRHVRLAVQVGRNALAAVLLIAGIAMLVLPGQGLLTILVGLVVADFRRKRQAELWLVRHAHVFAALGVVRSAMRRAPLHPPPMVNSEPDRPGTR